MADPPTPPRSRYTRQTPAAIHPRPRLSAHKIISAAVSHPDSRRRRATGPAALPPPLAPPGAHKAADAEVPEERQHRHRAKQLPVTRGTAMPATPPLPDALQGEERHHPKEDARNLQPEHAGEPHHGSPCCLCEAPAPAPETPWRIANLGDGSGRGAGCGPSRLPGRRRTCCRRTCCRRRLGYRLAGRRRRTPWLRRDRVARATHLPALAGTPSRVRAFARWVLCRGRVHRSHQRLHRLPRSDPKCASKANRVHPRSVACHARPRKARLRACQSRNLSTASGAGLRRQDCVTRPIRPCLHPSQKQAGDLEKKENRHMRRRRTNT